MYNNIICMIIQAGFKLSEWELIDIKPLCKTYKNSINKTLCEQYLINVANAQQKSFILSRMSQTIQQVIKVFHCDFFTTQTKDFSECLAKIYIEKITIKLFDIIQLPNNMIAAILEDVLIGYHYLYNSYGPLKITSHMIGFDDHNQIKVWLSENPLNNFKDEEVTDSRVMVESIFTIFQKYTNSYQDRNRNMDFIQAFEYLGYKKLIIYSKGGLTLSNTQKQPTIELSRVNSVKSISIGNHSRRQTIQTNNLFHQSIVNSPKINIHQTSSKILFDKSTFLKPPSTLRFDTSRYTTNQNISYQSIKQTQKPDHFKKMQIPIKKQLQGQQGQDHKYFSVGKPIPSTRTTLKNVSLQRLDTNKLQIQLINENISKDSRLKLIEDTLEQEVDVETQRICNIYNHALRFDPLMYHELKKVNGRISLISNDYTLKRLNQVSQQSIQHFKKKSLNPSIEPVKLHFKERQEKIEKILEKQRQKRDKNSRKTICQDKTPKYSIESVTDYAKQLQSYMQKKQNKPKLQKKPSSNSQTEVISDTLQKSKSNKTCFKQEFEKLLF